MNSFTSLQSPYGPVAANLSSVSPPSAYSPYTLDFFCFPKQTTVLEQP